MRSASSHVTIHVVVSCKGRKTVPIPPELEFARIGDGSLRQRVNNWVARLKSFPVESVPAGQLYAGDHWAVVRRVAERPTQGVRTKVWIASAGYGLIGFDAKIKPYSATFVAAHEQGVAGKAVRYTSADWWRELSAADFGLELPRTVEEVAKVARKENAYVLLALSNPYATALAYDIKAASRILPDRIGLVSVGLGDSDARELVKDCLLPAGAKLKQREGIRGAMQGVNSRLAATIVDKYPEWYPSTSALSGLLADWMDETTELVMPQRPRQTDVEVEAFVEGRLLADQSLSKTKLLRGLRDSGLACEQHRFGSIYARVAERVRTAT
jgi:hypothetical protein